MRPIEASMNTPEQSLANSERTCLSQWYAAILAPTGTEVVPSRCQQPPPDRHSHGGRDLRMDAKTTSVTSVSAWKSPGDARRFVRLQDLARLDCSTAVADAKLLVSELVTNAVQQTNAIPHSAPATAGLAISPRNDVLRFEVSDCSSSTLEMQVPNRTCAPCRRRL